MTRTSRPEDFDDFWRQVCRELDATPIAAEEEHLPIRSTDFCQCYAVRFTGIGPYRLFGYLSVPLGDGPFPTILNGPGYRSVVEPLPQGDANEKRGRFIVFSTASRGQRNADEPFAARFPGLMTESIDAPESYVFRGIVADWLRAVDYLLTRPEVDRSRLAAIKLDGMPLITAALRPQLTHVVATPGSFYNVSQRLPPELEDYLRESPEKRERVLRTLSYFDPVCFAPDIHATTLLWADRDAATPLVEALNGPTEVRHSTYSSYKDGFYQEQWITEQFGFAEPIVPANWPT